MSADEQDGPGADLNRVLILAPYRKDADYIAELVSGHGIPAEMCRNASSLAEALLDPPGVLVSTHEAISRRVLDTVGTHLAAQPDWSELPIVILLDEAAPQARISAALETAWPRSRLIFYQRPVAPLELVSGIQSALLARHPQREVRDHLEREAELRRELNHRVKNILASIMSIFQMTRRGAETLDDFAKDFEGRLTSLAEVHSAVFRAGGEAVSLVEVAEKTFAPYRDGGPHDRILIEGPPLMVTRDSATTLGLCLHELATNAIKYGALSVPDGRATLRWALSSGDDPALRLEWTESGGPSVTPPSRTGYGTRYLRAALTGLFGAPPAIDYPKDGLSCVAVGPVSRICVER